MQYPKEIKLIVFEEKTDKYDIWVTQCLDFDIAAHGDKPEDALYEFERLFFGQIAAALDAGVMPLESVPKAPDFFWTLYQKANLLVKPIDHRFRFRLRTSPPSVPHDIYDIIDSEPTTRLATVPIACFA